ncbi:hypothetical protein [Polynucleobacter asymbioticus]|jgi:2,4-dienoyl-CoA reductase-like NADH-dependent reductase (Old Yellow Enzyme family)|uniref:Uncharacterized protein n=1 Tax=Polynucleobacter asymbioticus TaxID=576611 RepID=A0AAC9IRH8_9BURK|nr:hypothetical protein [Polynucleobacter asymbioticus]APB99037.1 hypothetical protein A4F89_06695 [Polynucleobacter asymbioticus]APC01339.1 hypothetical protein AOC25_06795 [Polynucleobacter asymbioticus]
MPLTVTIQDNDDGTYTVSEKDSDQAEDAGAAGAGTDTSSGAGAGGMGEEAGKADQTVNSVGEALRIARGLLTNDSQVEDANKAAPTDDNTPMSGNQTKEAWNAEATKRDQAKKLFS